MRIPPFVTWAFWVLLAAGAGYFAYWNGAGAYAVCGFVVVTGAALYRLSWVPGDFRAPEMRGALLRGVGQAGLLFSAYTAVCLFAPPDLVVLDNWPKVEGRVSFAADGPVYAIPAGRKELEVRVRGRTAGRYEFLTAGGWRECDLTVTEDNSTGRVPKFWPEVKVRPTWTGCTFAYLWVINPGEPTALRCGEIEHALGKNSHRERLIIPIPRPGPPVELKVGDQSVHTIDPVGEKQYFLIDASGTLTIAHQRHVFIQQSVVVDNAPTNETKRLSGKHCYPLSDPIHYFLTAAPDNVKDENSQPVSVYYSARVVVDYKKP